MYHDKIKQCLADIFVPVYLSVINESHLHHTSKGAESHFKVVIVSSQFVSLQLLQRHRLVYTALSSFLQNGVHALAIHTFTPDEWHQMDGEVANSPHCRG